jgi:isopentenyl phosphate kinase
MRSLNQYVLDLMNKTGMKAAPVPTCSSVIFNNGELATMDFRMYDKIMALGAVPVGFGDVVFDTKRVFTICSADNLMYALAKEYRPAKVVFVTDVDGLFDKDPDDHSDARLIPLVTSLEDLPKGLQPQYIDGKDVTGGMAAKARQAMAIAELGLEVWLVNGHEEERLALVLEGKQVIGTKFISKKAAAPKAKVTATKGHRRGDK